MKIIVCSGYIVTEEKDNFGQFHPVLVKGTFKWTGSMPFRTKEECQKFMAIHHGYPDNNSEISVIKTPAGFDVKINNDTMEFDCNTSFKSRDEAIKVLSDLPVIK